MALSMARPFKHPKSGVYYFRKRVPERLKAVLKKTEELRSLGTKDPREAKVRHSEVASVVEAEWQAALGNRQVAAAQPSDQTGVAVSPLSQAEAFKLADKVRVEFISTHWASPGDQRFWDLDKGSQLLKRLLAPNFTDVQHSFEHAGYEINCRLRAEELLAEFGYPKDHPDKQMVVIGVARAYQAAAQELADFAHGRSVSADLSQVGAARTQLKPLAFLQAVEKWSQHRRVARKTAYSATLMMNELAEHVGHADLTLLTRANLQSWRTALVERGLSNKTIADTKFALLKSILSWAVEGDLIDTNPAEKLRLARSDKTPKRRGYNGDEAQVVLRAARAEREPYKRWVPLICAYTGARLSEVCQLRKEDITTIEGQLCIRITDDAGSLKNQGSFRTMPIHSAVVQEGFIELVEAAPVGPLFVELKPDKFGSRGGTGSKRLCRWIRSLGITDTRIAPSHSWRHMFKTRARTAGLQSDVVDALLGHTAKTAGDSYGEFSIDALKTAIEKMPPIATS